MLRTLPIFAPRASLTTELAHRALHRGVARPKVHINTTIGLGRSGTLQNKEAAFVALGRGRWKSSGGNEDTRGFEQSDESAVITVTPRAADRFKTLLEKRNLEKGAVQLCVSEKGCAGLSYSFNFHHTPKVQMDNGQSAITVAEQEGFSVIVDRKSLGFLIGCEVDWLEGDVTSQFVFKNPNATHSCPCGRSFAT